MSEFLEKGVQRIPTLSGIKFTDEDVSGEGRKCLKVDGGNLTVFNGFDQVRQVERKERESVCGRVRGRCYRERCGEEGELQR